MSGSTPIEQARRRRLACITVTRAVSRALECRELTGLDLGAIDIDLARMQNAAYEQALRDAGCDVRPSAPVFRRV